MNAKLEAVKQKQMEAAQRQSKASGEGKSKKPWSEEEMAFLIKTVNLFPAGTVARWEHVYLHSEIFACYITETKPK